MQENISSDVTLRNRTIATIIELLIHSPFHKTQYNMLGIGERILKPLENGQYKIFMKENKPIAFVNWAFLDEKRGEQLATMEESLKPEEWNCGEELWFVEWVCPFGDTEEIFETLSRNFPDHTVAKRLVVDMEIRDISVEEISLR